MEISACRYLILKRTNDKKNSCLDLSSMANDIVDDAAHLIETKWRGQCASPLLDKFCVHRHTLVTDQLSSHDHHILPSSDDDLSVEAWNFSFSYLALSLSATRWTTNPVDQYSSMKKNSSHWLTIQYTVLTGLISALSRRMHRWMTDSWTVLSWNSPDECSLRHARRNELELRRQLGSTRVQWNVHWLESFLQQNVRGEKWYLLLR